ncbi:MAG: excinuclease ABC subunit UvrA [Deinococcales bacterium]
MAHSINSFINIRGAKHHNLKNLDLSIPRDKLVVITGVSGSGKSSLAFDTLYAEGQRRYVESLSAYARQFLGQMEKPKVDYIGGLSPAIAIEQKTVSKNPRSTVGTVTEVLDYLRVLYSNIGMAHCPQCGREVSAQSAQEIVNQLSQLPADSRFQLLAPVVQNRKGTHGDVIGLAQTEGFVRARVNGEVMDLANVKLDKKKKHDIDIVVDRLKMPEELDDAFLTRLTDSVETTLRTANGLLRLSLETEDGSKDSLLSESYACPYCELSFPELSPQMFSFNSPLGMCEDCQGLGNKLTVDPNLIIENPSLSLNDGALKWYGEVGKKTGWTVNSLKSIAEHYDFSLDTPWQDLPETVRDALLYGSKGEKIRFKHGSAEDDEGWKGEVTRPLHGIIYNINRRYHGTASESMRTYYQAFMRESACPSCQGSRLRSESRAVTVSDKSLVELSRLSIAEAHGWISGLEQSLSKRELDIAGEVIKEIRERLQFMLNVGLHYLTLDRSAGTLSGGEGQRIRLASQIGNGLMGVLYILDEPSIGLHAKDNQALIETLLRLRDMGNSVLVVEHDEDTMKASDWIIDLGPGAGVKGGELVAEGSPKQLSQHPKSLTGQYLSGKAKVGGFRSDKREPTGYLRLEGVSHHNLREVSVALPLGMLTVVTGVSGSGKSSLITDTLYPALARELNRSQDVGGTYAAIEGLEQLDKVIHITQDPIGRTPRSNPATYVGLFDDIREIFTLAPEAKKRGYKAGRFSFNVKGGRCEACAGHGQNRIEMHFLADVWVTCRECGGKRYNRETLAVKYKGKHIADVLDMDVQEAVEFFENHSAIHRMLKTLHDVGLDYLKLGQSATTLSGGEPSASNWLRN